VSEIVIKNFESIDPKLFGIIASQMHKLNLGQSIQNFVHPKLFMASQIIYDIPNYYDIPKLGFPLTFPLLPTINTFCTQTVIFFITMKIIYFYKMLPNGFFSLPNFLFLLLSF